MAEQIIDVGTAPNNGTGDPLRTAFIKTDNNFDQIWAAGPVGSNVRIQNNVVSTLQVNQDLALSPNGVGNVRLNNNTIPGANNTWFLGSTTNQWRGVYANSITAGNVTINNNLVVPGDVTIEGNLTVEGDTIQIGNIVTDTKTIQLSNTASTANAATGSGITVGANDNIATLLYNSASNVWTTNIGVTATGNITAPYFVGNGALLTGITSYSNTNATSLLASFGSNTISTTGNITAGNLLAPGAVIATLLAGGNLQVTGGVSGSTVTATGNVTGGNILTAGIVSATGNITANYFVGNGSQLTGIVSSYGNANVANYLPTFSGNISAGNVSASGNISGAYVKGNGSELTNLPAPTVTQDISSTGAMSIMTYDGVIKYVNYATVEPSSGNITGGNISTTGNVTANYFIGDGSQLTNLPGGNATLPLANGTSNFNIATANGSANITANAVTYTFGADSRLTVPAAANVPGKISALTAATGRGHDLRISAGNTNGCSVAGGDMYLSAGVGYGGVGWGAGNVNIVTGDRYSNDIGNTWRFDFFGNLTLPGNTIAINYLNGNLAFGTVTFNNEAVIGTGTSNTQSGLYLAPDPVSLANDLYLRVRGNIQDEPTHIHFDTGNNQYYNQFIGDDNKYIQLANTGNIVINTNDYAGNSAQWNFDTTGNLTLPQGGVVYETNIPDGGLDGNTIALKPSGGTNADQQLLVYPTTTDANHLHLTSGNLYNTELFLGDDNLYVKLANTGNVVVNSNDGTGNTAQWNFDYNGVLTLPKGGVVSEGASPLGLGNTIALTPSGGSDADQQLLVYPTGNVVEGNHLHLTTGNLLNTELYLGNDDFYVKLANTGDIIVNTAGNTAQWTFGTDGLLTFPTGNLVITPDDPAGNIAFITSTDHPLGILSTGANGAVSSLWVEDMRTLVLVT